MAADDHGGHPGEPGARSLVGRAVAASFRLQHLIGTHAGRTLASVRRGENAFIIIVAIVIGVLGAYGAILFRKLILLSHGTFFFTFDQSLQELSVIPWWQRLLMPSVGGLLVGLIITKLCQDVKGSGVPEVMESVARRGGLIKFRIIGCKALAAAITLGSGGSAGREGPIIHIGSAIGSAVGQFLKVPARRLRTFVACGAAAGIAATFNAPIAGALFAVEVVLADLAVASLSPIVISSVVATVISRHYLGDYPALRVPEYHLESPLELILYVGLGLAAGFISVFFIKLLFGIGSLFDRSPLPEWLRPGVGGLGVGLIALALPQVFGVGYEAMDAALWGEAPWTILGVLILGKLVATSLTLGSGGSGGVFAPSLFLGAMLGATMGSLYVYLFPGWTAGPGAYALVGMGALVAGTTHAPIAAILIIFEMTNDYHIIPPLMLACVVAILISTRFHRDSIYTEKLARRGVKLFEGRDVNLLRGIPVRDVMDEDAPTISADVPLSELVPTLLSSHHPALLVTDAEGCYLGAVVLSDIKAILPEIDDLAPFTVAADVVDDKVPYVLPNDNLDLVMHLFGRTHRDELPVCDGSSTKRIVGVVTRNAVIDAYNQRVFQLDLSGGFSSLVAAVHGGRSVEVLGGLHLAEVELPPALAGKTLAQTNLRRDFELEVVLIHASDIEDDSMEGRPAKVPTPEIELVAGDRLLVMGTPESIEKLRGYRLEPR